MLLFRCSVALAAACLVFAGAAAVEMPYVEPDLRDRPPVAAPTNRIDVAPMTIVRSQSEQLGDFSAGLIQGLLARTPTVRGAAFVAVQGDHVIVQNNFGSAGAQTTFEMGSMADLFAAIAAMREVERGTLALDADIATVLGETTPRNVTVGQVLTHQAGDFAQLTAVVEKAAGQGLPAYLQANLFTPLAMNTGAGDGPLRFDAAALAHLLIALVNGGVYGGAAVLQPATVELMERTQFTAHDGLPGWSYGFKEMRRNNRLALQRDGVSQNSQVRLVVLAQERIAYLVALDGQADAAFWRTLDDALFDRTFPVQTANLPAPTDAPPPTRDQASAAAGNYEQAASYAGQVAPLKTAGRRLNVRAADDGSLILSGAERAVLAPRPGGIWASDDGNVSAALRETGFVISTGEFAPLALWKRPLLYALLALLVAIAGAGFGYYEFVQRKRAWRPQSAAVLAPAGATVLFLALALLAWLAALGA